MNELKISINDLIAIRKVINLTAAICEHTPRCDGCSLKKNNLCGGGPDIADNLSKLYDIAVEIHKKSL